ncbi:Gfo/Idh/MocA family protein [Enterococcus mundtii]|uniref:Gfo/Idh/MocA family protein n=1 Tax=Enterococcus TaxID=1350 RepID=UPI000D3D4F97|nr:Gfo/Idh/MocA family oxidoreductase [Enterococcus mundtii]PTO37089.1 oxidoreductase [Enterococcus mundtii]PTO39401.1 oxidoreductase [Enterococcus mundtii]
MKVIFFGLGSIGKRHLKNLIKFGHEHSVKFDITAYSSSGKKEFSDIAYIEHEEELKDNYDLAFITNPTFKHLPTLNMIYKKANYIFLEKPVFSESVDLAEYDYNEQNIYVAAPLRYKKIMDLTRKKIMDSNIYSVRSTCSTYLPDWRKNTDYRVNYSAYKSMGGGVELDCIHELDYIIHLFGFPKEVKKQFGKFSHLEIGSNDLATYLLSYEDKIVEVHLDYFGKDPMRKLELFTTEGLVEINLLTNEVSINNSVVCKLVENSNDMYEEELKYFLKNVITNKSNWNSLYHANEVLKIAEEK